jgi:phosphoribosylformylglycinamidine synthase
MASGKGLRVDLAECKTLPHAALFGEDQARYVIAVPADVADFVCINAESAGVPFRRLGTVGGDALAISGLLTLPVEQLREAHESWFPAFMDGGSLAAAE